MDTPWHEGISPGDVRADLRDNAWKCRKFSAEYGKSQVKEYQSVFENFFAIEIGGLLFAFSNIL